MTKLSFSILQAIWLLIMVVVMIITSAKAGGDHRPDWLNMADGRGGCRGSMAECLIEDNEFAIESTRRVLATSDYISYKALQRNTVPCSRRGASYYNCKEGAEANPYSRQCSAISRCRS